MLPLPGVAEPLLMSLSIAFTEPTFKRILVLLVGTVLAKGRRTITSILWIMRKQAPGHMTDYHRVFSRAPCSLFPLGQILCFGNQLEGGKNRGTGQNDDCCQSCDCVF